MIRHLIPRLEWARWHGSALTKRGGEYDDVNGRILCVQWLGLMVELAIGRVR